MSSEAAQKAYPDIDPDRLHAATAGILTGIAFGYNEGDPDLPGPDDHRYQWAECVALDAVRAVDRWEVGQ